MTGSAPLPPPPTEAVPARAATVVDLKHTTARGGLISLAGQGGIVLIRTGSMVLLARLVTPEEFGLVGMVTAFTGFLGMFRDAGLSLASVQHSTVTREQTSALFWINLAMGSLLALVCLLAAPALTSFYHEPRLQWITPALGVGFLFYGASAQHRASLQRNLRFGTLVATEVLSLLVATIAGVLCALAGWGTWALVVLAVTSPAVAACGVWWTAGWWPDRPARARGLGGMLRFGGTVTLNSLIAYLVYNTEKVLLGRFLGAEVLGIYGRAYHLLSLPSENLNCVMGAVMFPALSRVQHDPPRLRRYFCASYSLFLAVVVPLTLACALFADDIVLVLLGARWHEVAGVFRLLTPTMLVFALVNPFTALMQASGRALRSLKIAFFIAPTVVAGYLCGLPHGGPGVALGFSAAMVALVLPILYWARRDTLISASDIARAALYPLLASLAAAAVVVAAWQPLAVVTPALVRLTLRSTLLFSLYALILLYGLNLKGTYWELVQSARRARQPKP